MQIILKKDVANLGHADDVVTVKTGYAMNYLIPQGFAIAATPSALKQHAETIRQRAHKEAKKVADAQALAASLDAILVKVAAKVSEAGKIYGSITTAQLSEALAAAGVEVDKKDITILADEVKELGIYDAEVKCYKAVKGTFKFEVVAEEA
ncbi:MAG: 50S ribosomal protein L9 [Bacteroidales bacterium]|nr:50S ribosomal protein L9 [Bacteroidales bacterium]